MALQPQPLSFSIHSNKNEACTVTPFLVSEVIATPTPIVFRITSDLLNSRVHFLRTGALSVYLIFVTKIKVVLVVEASHGWQCINTQESHASPDPYRFPSNSQGVVLKGICFEPKPLSFLRHLEANRKTS